MMVLFFGLVGASFLSRAALLAAVNANLRSSQIVSTGIRALVVVFTLSVVSEVLGIAEHTLLIAFGTMFAAAMLGLAIAFGLGGQELARKYLEKKLARQNHYKDDKEDELSPL
jgi:hypothetical protein